MLERSHFPYGRWIPPGQAVAVGAHAIPGGLVYLGRHVRSPAGVEPSLINPELPVERGAATDSRAAATDIGPPPAIGPRLAYHLLSARARGAYLDWLATGRRADVAPGLVLLFCFGLERRVLLDTDDDPAARSELPAITAEVRRLRARYGTDQAGEAGGRPTLRRSLDDLLALLELLVDRCGRPPAGGTSPSGGTPPGGADRIVGQGPMGVRVALARFAAASAPVPVDWAHAWIGHHPALPARSVQQHCSTEFDRLFALRYQERHGAGLVPPDDVPGIRLRYRPAHPDLPTTLVCREDLPDVLTEPRCTRALGSLVDSAARALEPYRQWLVRFPEGRGSVAAASLLPRELVDVGHGRVGALRVWAERQLDGRPWAVVDAGEFWAFWSTAAPDRMARDEAAALLAVLAMLDLGVEPDVRFGAPALTRRPAVLFRLGRPTSDRPSAHFPAAAAIMRCAAAVAAASATSASATSASASATSASRPVDPRQAHGAAVLATARDLAAALPLSPGEDLRLVARLAWLLTTGVDIDRLGRHTARLTSAQREAAGHYLVTVAHAADPAVGPAGVGALTRIYRILGLEPDLVFQRLHERSVGRGASVGVRTGHRGRPASIAPRPPSATAPTTTTPGGAAPGATTPGADERDEPVVVQLARAAPNGYALPWAQERAEPHGVHLDRTAIDYKIVESRAAATLLSEIFDAVADDDPAGPGGGRVAAGPADAEQIATLDAAHSALLRALAGRASWSRAEFAELAATHGVLPDGALDMLNEAAIEATGDPVVADGGTLAVDNDVLVELLG